MTWHGERVAVVLPTYNEKDSIAECIRRFQAMDEVDEVVVVNNNAAPGTSDEVATTGAREVLEPRQGYGAAILRGLRETAGAQLVCICEPDGTFDPEDLRKLLPFMAECEMVVGSRTVGGFIWDGANMGWFLRWGNWGVAKLVEVLFSTTSLSDVGCTFRVVRRGLADEILRHAVVDGSAHGLEAMLLVAADRRRMVQVPVNYHPRVGESSVTGDLRKTLALGSQMVGHVVRTRARTLPRAARRRT